MPPVTARLMWQATPGTFGSPRPAHVCGGMRLLPAPDDCYAVQQD